MIEIIMRIVDDDDMSEVTLIAIMAACFQLTPRKVCI